MLKTTLRLLATASCLTFVIGLQVFAASQIEQPKSIEPVATLNVKHDQKLTPAGCTSSCCGGETASDRAVCSPKRVTKEVKKYCWKVKSEMICIPSFRFQCNWKNQWQLHRLPTQRWPCALYQRARKTRNHLRKMRLRMGNPIRAHG